MTYPTNESPSATATTLAGQAGTAPNSDIKSVSSKRGRKRDRVLKFFRESKPDERAKIQPAKLEASIQHIRAASTEVGDYVDSSLKEVGDPEPGAQVSTEMRNARLIIFSENVSKPALSIEVPKIGDRVHSTPQLVLCSSLLHKSQDVLELGLKDQAKDVSHGLPVNHAHLDWVNAMEEDSIEQHRIRWLRERMVEEYSKAAVKDSAIIAEIVLLGPVLDREHYRKLLNCFIFEFVKAKILDVYLLQGLVQLVQCASEGYLVADDLVKILSTLRAQLQSTHQQSAEHPYHLTLAVSRLLDVMAEHKVQDVKRIEEHEPLSQILSGLRSSSDPYLMYQASYAFQALQYVPDDETALEVTLRHSAGVADSPVKISDLIKLDLRSVLEGLKGFQEALSSTYDTAKSGYEGFFSLMESGRGVFESLKDGLSTGRKRIWYPALLAAENFVRQGQLADLNRLVVEAPCCRDPLFQWGICQLLGEIVVDEAWDVFTRQQAIDLLVGLYSNDTEWAQDASVKNWALAIIVQVGDTSDPAIKDHAKDLLNDLRKNSYSATTHSYPLKDRLAMPTSSPLLAQVQEIPYVEYDLQALKRRRLEEEHQSVYIPPMAKSSPQAPDYDVFPLMEKVTEFVASERQVMLILGGSGAGKSTFNRHLECTLWRDYKCGGRIPLFILMPALRKPESELIAEQLRMHNFTEPQIRELTLHRQLIVICDGYDESQLTINLHTTNRLNQPGQWTVKLVVSCRSQYLGNAYRKWFMPQGKDHYSAPAHHLFQEAVITPFSRFQIEEYVKQYVLLEPRPWATEDYMEKLNTIPSLMDLVTDPFLLTLSLEGLPTVVQGRKDLTTVRITRVALYASFVEHWIGANKRRLEQQNLKEESRIVLNNLIEDNFERHAIEYQKHLAAEIFQEQDGRPVIAYSHIRDMQSWKAKYFGPDLEPTLLRGCSLLNRVGNQYRFIHRSILEYFYARFIYEPSGINDEFGQTTGPSVAAFVHPIADHPLSQRNLVSEPSVIQFLCELVQEDAVYKERLLAIVEESKTNCDASQAASNAITILVRTGVMFNGADLQGIQIPGADLSGGQFDSAQLQGADLRNTNLRGIWLRQAELSRAQMDGVQFGEWPFLKEEHAATSCAYSPDEKTFAVGLEDGSISLYKTSTWEKASTLKGHTNHVTSVMFSPNGQQIASGSSDRTVRLWDAQTGAPGGILNGHTLSINSVVISPSGQQIASSSDDETVRLWDAQTCAPGAILRGHSSGVTSVVFSPSGQQIASGSNDRTIRLWDVQTGVPGNIIECHTFWVKSLVFSPSGQQIATGNSDGTARLWDAQTGAPGAILKGDIFWVMSVAFAPHGQQIATGNSDKTVRLWDAQTGTPGAILKGHTSDVLSVVFSPSARLIASGSDDNTVRLWETEAGAPGAVLSGHEKVASVAFSPNGQQVASGSQDQTIRLWDTQTGAPGAILKGHTDWVKSAVFSPSGQQIASGSEDRTVRIWDAQTGALGFTLSGHSSGVTSVVFSPSGHQIASGSKDQTVRLWDAQTGACTAVLSGHTDWVMSVVFSPDGQQIASGSGDWTVRLWDAPTGAPGSILTGHTDYIRSVVFSPSGQQVASGSWDKTVRLWNVHTGVPGVILRGHTSYVTSVAFSPSGKQIASGSGDMTMRLWNVDSGQCLTVVKEFYGSVKSVAWYAYGDRSYIATGCQDKSIRLWQVIGDGHLIHLRWSSTHDRLVVSNTNISTTQGLSKTNRRLLEMVM